MPSFKDRLLSPKVARAMMSPAGILVAGAGGAVVIASGAPLLLAPVVVAGLWSAKVGLAIPKKKKRVKVDYTKVAPPWRNFVVEALTAQRRFDSIPEPKSALVADRLGVIAVRVAEVVERSFEIAKEGERLTNARRLIDSKSISDQLSKDPTDAVRRALESQQVTGERLDKTIKSTHDRLTVIDARLDETVARAIELSATNDFTALNPIEDDLTDLVDELESVRLAVSETSR